MLPLILLLVFGAVLAAGVAALTLPLEWQRRRARVDRLGGWLVEEERPGLFRRAGDLFDRSARGERLRLRLARANLRLKPSEWLFLQLFVGFVSFYVLNLFLGLPAPLALAAAAGIGIAGPGVYLRGRQDAYIKALEGQLVETAGLMGNGLRAGLSVPQAIDTVARELPAPAGREFGRLARELALGVELDRSLEDMLERLPSEELRVLFLAIIVQRRVGGNLARVLSIMAATMAERARMAEEIRNSTAEVRFASLVGSALPVGFLVLLKVGMPAYAEPLFGSVAGWIILAFYGAVQAVAFLIIRRIATIRV